MYPFLTFWLPTVHCFNVGRWTIGDSLSLRSHTTSSPSLPFWDWSDTNQRYQICSVRHDRQSYIDYTLILQQPRLQLFSILWNKAHASCMFNVKNRTTATSRSHQYHQYQPGFYAHAPSKGMKDGISSASLLPTQKNPRSTPDSRILFFLEWLNPSRIPPVLANQPNRRQKAVLHCRSSRVAHGLFFIYFFEKEINQSPA